METSNFYISRNLLNMVVIKCSNCSITKLFFILLVQHSSTFLKFNPSFQFTNVKRDLLTSCETIIKTCNLQGMFLWKSSNFPNGHEKYKSLILSNKHTEMKPDIWVIGKTLWLEIINIINAMNLISWQMQYKTWLIIGCRTPMLT